MSTYLKSIMPSKELTKVASLSETNLSEEITPMPMMESNLTELPILENAPNSYSSGNAALEILNPNKNNWAAIPRTVREVQEQLIRLGVRGVSNIQNFDRTMRLLNSGGRVRREKIEGTYKYYGM